MEKYGKIRLKSNERTYAQNLKNTFDYSYQPVQDLEGIDRLNAINHNLVAMNPVINPLGFINTSAAWLQDTTNHRKS